MPNIGAPELILIALVILLLFGATRLPKLGRSMGQSIRGFKKGLNDDVIEGDDEQDMATTIDAKVVDKGDHATS